MQWQRVQHQSGVFTRAQARNWGLSDRQIDRKLASGQWVTAPGGRPGVLCAAGTPWSHRSALWAAVLATGPPCALAVASAASVYGWCAHPVDVILAVPRSRRLSPRVGVELHRLQLQSGEVTRREGLPITSAARTVADCLRLLPKVRAVEILDRSQQRGHVDLAVVAAALRRTSPGSRQAREMLASFDGAAMAAERRLLSLVRASSLSGWVANFGVDVSGRRVVIDLAFPATKIAIEVDGFAYHSDVAAFRSDRVRQNALVTAGWLVLRFTWYDLVERPDSVVAEISAAVTSRSARAQ